MKQLITILFLTSLIPSIWAQEVISSGGDSFNNGNIQLDCTIGELATETISSGSILSQGFHQGYYTVTSIDEVKLLGFNVYPNPTTDWIQIESESSQDKMWITVKDLEGRTVKDQAINGFNDSKISVSDLASGPYVVQLFSEDKNQFFSPKIIQKQ